MSLPEQMEAEFDDMASWTADAVAHLGSDHAVAAACRGTASPAALDWLARTCGLGAGTLLVDVGGGMGGPAVWARDLFAVRPLLVEPMPGACVAARRMFGLPAVVGEGGAVPVRTGAADAAWCLGVLCTTTEKQRLLAELRRILPDGGRLGLFVLLAEHPDPPDPPAGNTFPTTAELDALLARVGFAVDDAVDLAELPSAPPTWSEQVARVDAEVAAQHATHPAFQQVQEQERRMASLVGGGHVRGRLLVATAR